MEFRGQGGSCTRMPMGNNQAVPLAKLLCEAYLPPPASVAAGNNNNEPAFGGRAPQGMQHNFMLSLRNTLHDVLDAQIEGDEEADDTFLETTGTANERNPAALADVSDGGDQTASQLNSTEGAANM
ncbi:expressed unknown protein [Seminavis robusta]|uniref:Uncharacterized protein n=1 Tax=Seminavis robusta TaxID=568900 RepID=A0A9N8DFW5_9STRA|nr:expressed unknown protein [Seminavis robusta]|eukprot:Sro121_g059030.1 n/a (126) ;mRNA; f:111282-111659